MYARVMKDFKSEGKTGGPVTTMGQAGKFSGTRWPPTRVKRVKKLFAKYWHINLSNSLGN